MKPLRSILLASVASLALSMLCVEVLGKYSDMGLPVRVLGALIWLVSVAITLAAGIGAVRGAFERRGRRELMTIVVGSYFAIIFIFAGVYYKMSFYGDHSSALLKYQQYRDNAERVHANLLTGGSLPKDHRAFSGVEYRLWSGVDWPVDALVNPAEFDAGGVAIGPGDMLETARQPTDEVICFIPGARMHVLGNCLYYSATTITTLGYGDISPTAWYTRAASVCEVLTGILVIGVALTMGLSKPETEKSGPLSP